MTKISPRRTLPALFACALLGASAADAQISSSPVDDFVASASSRGSGGRPRRGCAPLREPHPVPSISVMADSAALSAEVAAFAREFPIASDSLPFAAYTVAYGPAGVQSLRPVNYRLPAGQAQRFATLVRGHLRPIGAASAYLRLRVLVAEQPRFVVDNVERCRPELRTDFHMRTATQAEYRAPISLRARVRVGADGRILSVQLLRSTRDAEIDTWVQSVLQAGTAVPGLIDGVPVEMEVDEDVRIRFN
jgi:hypothetical protein